MRGDRGEVQNLSDDFELVFGLLVHDQRPALRQHRKQVSPPLAPLRIDFMRLSKRHQMADGPSDDVAVAVKIAFTFAGCAEHARDITRNRWLFGQYGDGAGVRSPHL